jgi:predicted ABC-type ATPase
MPQILVLAGPNGAGKSSIGGEFIRQAGQDYYNPDERTRAILEEHPNLNSAEANGLAWQQGYRLLQQAAETGRSFAFETTLGGNSIRDALVNAAKAGCTVNVWYCALDSAEAHIQRVAERVAKGGHNIPSQKIYQRYDRSRLNLVKLMPLLSNIELFDNSRGLNQSGIPQPLRVLSVQQQQIRHCLLPKQVPQWAKPIVAAAIKAHH